MATAAEHCCCNTTKTLAAANGHSSTSLKPSPPQGVGSISDNAHPKERATPPPSKQKEEESEKESGKPSATLEWALEQQPSSVCALVSARPERLAASAVYQPFSNTVLKVIAMLQEVEAVEKESEIIAVPKEAEEEESEKEEGKNDNDCAIINNGTDIILSAKIRIADTRMTCSSQDRPDIKCSDSLMDTMLGQCLRPKEQDIIMLAFRGRTGQVISYMKDRDGAAPGLAKENTEHVDFSLDSRSEHLLFPQDKDSFASMVAAAAALGNNIALVDVIVNKIHHEEADWNLIYAAFTEARCLVGMELIFRKAEYCEPVCALPHAIAAGDMSVIYLLISHSVQRIKERYSLTGHDLHKKVHSQIDPNACLLGATRAGRLDFVKMCILWGADRLDDALCVAAARGHLSLVTYLVAMGARKFASALEYSQPDPDPDIAQALSKYMAIAASVDCHAKKLAALAQDLDTSLGNGIYSSDARRSHHLSRIVNIKTDQTKESLFLTLYVPCDQPAGSLLEAEDYAFVHGTDDSDVAAIIGMLNANPCEQHRKNSKRNERQNRTARQCHAGTRHPNQLTDVIKSPVDSMTMHLFLPYENEIDVLFIDKVSARLTALATDPKTGGFDDRIAFQAVLQAVHNRPDKSSVTRTILGLYKLRVALAQSDVLLKLSHRSYKLHAPEELSGHRVFISVGESRKDFTGLTLAGVKESTSGGRWVHCQDLLEVDLQQCFDIEQRASLFEKGNEKFSEKVNASFEGLEINAIASDLLSILVCKSAAGESAEPSSANANIQAPPANSGIAPHNDRSK